MRFNYGWWGGLVCFASAAIAQDPLVWQEVRSGKLIGSFRVTGRVVPLEGNLSIQSAKAAGRVVAILKHEGETVVRGTPLLGVNSAECITLQEEMRVAREKNLPELIESVHKRAQELDMRFVHGQCELVASSSGTITKRLAEIGMAFNIGDPLYQIVNTKHLTVELEVPEKDTQRISIGKKVLVNLPSDPGNDYPTKIVNIVPALDSVTRTSRVRVAPFEFRRIPSVDAFVTAEIETDSPEQTLILPSTALVFHHDKQWVVKSDKGQPLAVQVEVISEADGQSSIRSAGKVSPGDKVLSKGAIYVFRKLKMEKPAEKL